MIPELVELDAAVDGLYDAFAGHPLREWTDPCLLCCTTPDQEAALHAAPLRHLPVEDIEAYAQHAMGTWGDERELTHLLPRMFEIVSTADFDWPDLEHLMSTLHDANWRAWPRSEQDAVERYFMATWSVTLAQPAPTHTPDTVLCAIAQAVDDLTPYLSAWTSDTRAPASRHLVDYVLWSYQPARRRLTNEHWTNRRRQATQVIEWLRTNDVETRLTDLATAPGDSERATAALAALASIAAGGP